MSRIPFILLFFAISNYSFSQSIDEKKFHHYTTRDGLSDNKITAIVQDPTGYIWIATAHGLNRFDGVSFRQFLQNSEHNPIPDNEIFSMQQLPGDQLAIATSDGAQIISTATLQTKNLDIPSPEALRYWSNCCLYVHMDNDGNYGVSTKTGFYIFSSNGELKKRYDQYSAKDIGHVWMMFGNHIFKLPDGNMLEENRSGAYLYDRRKNLVDSTYQNWPGLQKIFNPYGRLRFFTVSAYKMLILDPKKNSFDLLDIRNGSIQSYPACFDVQEEINWQSKLSPLHDDLWAITSASKGFYTFKIDTVSWTISCEPKKHFNDYFCSIVYCDNKNRFWIGTNDGFFMEDMNPAIISSFSIPLQKNFNDFSITSQFITADKIFVGTDTKEIFILDKQTHQVVKEIGFKKKPARVDEIRSMLLVYPDTLWIASTAELLWLNTKNFTSGKLSEQNLYDPSTEFQYLFADRKNNKWIVSNLINDIYQIDPTKKTEEINTISDPLFKVNALNSLAEDKNGDIWFGGDAIAKWNYKSKKIDELIERLPSQKNRKRGYFVMNDDSGNIWTTINDDGIANLTGTKLVHVRPKNLLTDHSVDLAPALFDNKIFLATNNSIGFLNLHDLKSTIFDTQDGMPQQAITSHYLTYDDGDRSTWFACKNLICKISSNSNTNYTVPPILKIADISVLKDTFINYPSPFISLKHFQNNIKISLSTINFTDPVDMRFSYRVTNKKDTNWIETGTQPLILLTNVSPGDYKLEIKVYSYNNKWPEQITLIEIRIEPPFWKTWWFISFVGLIVIIAIYALYKRRIKQIRERANIDKQLNEFEMKALHAQMNPHFIFNCLNSIREMILHEENRQASHYLSKFAQLIRITLDNSAKPFISLVNTIDYLKRYLEMEQIRNQQFDYIISVDDDLIPDEIMIPPMLIQPFIENAIWHGAVPGKQMHLKILFQKINDRLVCIVDDDGIGIDASLKTKDNTQIDRNSFGIANVKERIHVLNEKYNLQSSIIIQDKSKVAVTNETGTIVKLYFSLNSLQ